jgi:hypothetical protein
MTIAGKRTTQGHNMDSAIKSGGETWGWGACVAVAILGTTVLVLGAMQRAPHLLFGGAMLAVIAAAGIVQMRALRPTGEGCLPSNAERSAWMQIGMGLAAIMVLGGMALGSMRDSLASYLLFAAYTLIVAFFPAFRHRFIEDNRGYREVAEDERDRAIRGQGDYLSKRLLECSLAGVAIGWVLVPGFFQSLDGPLQVAALLLLPVLAANVAGEARVARLHWQDRR